VVCIVERCTTLWFRPNINMLRRPLARLRRHP
jgi:hypothetical protein